MYGLSKFKVKNFLYCLGKCGVIVALGVSYLVGNSKEECVKLALFYTDTIIRIHPCR